MKTDANVQQDVIEELKWENAVNAENICVEVKDGIVTLDGTVSSYAEKWSAERAAQRVAGVLALTVRLDVKLADWSQRSDVEVAHAAQNVLKWMSSVPTDSIKVMVEGGWVTLSGEVDWDYQKQAAMQAVSNLVGVTGISDQVTIRTNPVVGEVKSEIEAALKRVAKTGEDGVIVDVTGDSVVLSGPVHDWSERELVKNSAWGTPGVRNVVDHMTIAD